MEEKHNNIFIGIIIGIALVLGIGWYIKLTEPKNIGNCLKACEEEGWNKTEDWIEECGEACLEEYKIK